MLVKKNDADLYEQYRTKMQKIADLKAAISLLNWDQETCLPPSGAPLRGRQLTTLTALLHGLLTESSLENLLLNLEQATTPAEKEGRNVRITLEEVRRNQKYPEKFVRQLSDTVSACFHGWVAARRKNDFAIWEHLLGEMVCLKQQEARLLGYEKHPYDALLQWHEKAMTTGQLDGLFSQVRHQLSPLLSAILDRSGPAPDWLRCSFPKDRQGKFGRELLATLGFDLDAGRLDVSEHPFTVSMGNQDVRLTTRIEEGDLPGLIFSCLHEGGHGLYEQGLDEADYGLPSGEAISLSIHESQSRLWENMVGRGKSFWLHQFPKLASRFPEILGKVSLQEFYQGINRVGPTLIRTESDELTYHFHVLIRYQIEKGLISGEFRTGDLREIWNQSYRDLLGVKVPDDLRGVLQDVHWSHGSFGYFPTYSLGSFLAAQFFETARREIPGLEASLAAGDCKTLLDWLRRKIHGPGGQYPYPELCLQVTGKHLDPDCFMEYARRKYGELYGGISGLQEKAG
ncbi:MAG TPA: carboxypeptidase M32 [Chitinophagaceae bacterium]|nr:carboxypeptidase M32 [Chitinophagaceae bacterium]